MLRSLYTAGTGMVAQQQNLDIISNNLANVNTTGFKGQRGEFQDLMYQNLKSATQGQDGSGTPEGIQIGLGTRLAATSSTFTQGSFQETDNPLNVAISGRGFFKLTQPDGSAAYTRDGSFKSDANGRVVNTDGLPLEPELTIPTGATAIDVRADGSVYAVPEGKSTAEFVGKIELTNVANPAGMSRLGGNLFAATDASGVPQAGSPGLNGTGKLQGGYVEGSNVEVVSEMVHMITAQRAYEINSKAIQTADDMLGIVNNLKR